MLFSAGTGGEGQQTLSAYEIKQLEQQNARLRETLVRMRDLSAHDKHEHQKLLKELDQKKSEIAELGRTKEKLSARVENMEQQIADLQEQVSKCLRQMKGIITIFILLILFFCFKLELSRILKPFFSVFNRFLLFV